MSSASSNNSGNNIVNDNDDDEGGGDGFEPYNPPADRFLTAQMWWIASELVRRHPHLRISGVEVDGADRLLIVHDEQDALSIQWDLVGGCKYLKNGVVQKISWIEMMAALSPHETVKRIEEGTGLGHPKSTPMTTPRSLAYRVIASALTSAVDDRREWYAVPALMLWNEDPADPTSSHFKNFPTALDARGEHTRVIAEQIETVGRGGAFFQPFWAVLRDLDTIAIIDAAGVIHTVMGETPLMPVYENINRKLTITTAQVLGAYLP
jgi:hypothetical protein